MADVISKMMQLLHALAPNEHENEWSATQISRELNIPVQTVHRLLSSMTKSGLVYQNKQTRKFRLGMTLMQFGFMVWDNISARTAAKPFMEILSRKTGASVYLPLEKAMTAFSWIRLTLHTCIKVPSRSGCVCHYIWELLKK